MTNQDKQSLVGQTIQHMVDKMPMSYSVLELLSSNAVLGTYLATLNKMKLALKILTPSLTAQPGFQARFQETIKTLLSLNSPYLLKLYDYGNDNENFYLVADYHKSPTLRGKLDEERRIPPDTALDYLQILIEALAYAAQNNVLHGFLSPQSVTISSKRGPLLGDIGIAPLIGLRLPRALSDDLTLAYYAAPEVIRGQPVSALSDQYSLTALFYEMVTGQPPYPASTTYDVIAQHASTPIPNPAAIDPSFAVLTPIIMRGLAKDPAQRFATYQDYLGAVQDAIRVVASPAAVVPTPLVPAPQPAPPARAPQPEPMPMDRTMPEGISIDQLRQQAAAIPNPPPPAPPELMPMDRTMPEGISINQLQQAAAIPNPPPPAPPPKAEQDATFIGEKPKTPAAFPPPAPAPARAPQPEPMDRTMPEGISIDQLRQAPPVPYEQPYVSPAARAPEPPASIPPYAAPYQPQSAPRNEPDNSPYAAPYVSPRQQEMPGGYSRPAPTPGMDKTMPDTPMAAYSPGTPMTSRPPESKGYDFGSIAASRQNVSGGQKTASMSKSSLSKGFSDFRSGLTGIMSVPRPDELKPQNQRRSPLLLVIVILVLFLIAAGVGLFVLHTIGVI